MSSRWDIVDDPDEVEEIIAALHDEVEDPHHEWEDIMEWEDPA